MPFSTPIFVFAFLPAVLLLQLASPRPLRNPLLLLASLLFYAWGEPRVVAVMLLSIAVNHLLGLAIARAATASGGSAASSARNGARVFLVAALAFDLAVLAWFKYANFFRDEVARLGLSLDFAEVALPIGISFYTFQAMSYVVDVYRGDVEAQRNPIDFALYIALFPQLIAGPIVRYRDIAADLVSRRIDLEGFAAGARRFVIGLGKKLLVADTVAIAADGVFDRVPAGELTASLAWLATACYAIQIYFDFSGYSDMAIGLGRMLGLRFRENFLHPYAARSVTEFWRRWHVSLSTWFRDYLYIPLGGNRGGGARTYANLLIVFFLCGLWHGASWSFVVWGLFHGALLILERAGLAAVLERLPSLARRAYLLFTVLIGWVFFRAETLEGALEVLAAMFGFGAGTGVVHSLPRYLLPHVAVALGCGIIGSAPWLPALRARFERTRGLLPELLGHAALLVVLLLCASSLAAGTHSPFIYFRF